MIDQTTIYSIRNTSRRISDAACAAAFGCTIADVRRVRKNMGNIGLGFGMGRGRGQTKASLPPLPPVTAAEYSAARKSSDALLAAIERHHGVWPGKKAFLAKVVAA